MKIWRYHKLDAVLFLLSIFHFVFLILLLKNWVFLPLLMKIAGFFILIFLTTYNIIIISHLLTHTPWFNSTFMNRLVFIINTINAGQSIQAYQLSHVRNHHRYNNDRKGTNGKTLDQSSTFQQGKNDEHASLWRYTLLGALASMVSIFKSDILSIYKMWRVGDHEIDLLSLVSRSSEKRRLELKQLQIERIVHFLTLFAFVLISWQWTLFCYVPAFFISLALVNMQNYYEHFGALPENKFGNSVSYYGKIYNQLTFNDGYHQEHHLFAAGHWSEMPQIRDKYLKEDNIGQRIISPVPAIIGFVDKNRKMLHRQPSSLSYVEQEVSLL